MIPLLLPVPPFLIDWRIADEFIPSRHIDLIVKKLSIRDLELKNVNLELSQE